MPIVVSVLLLLLALAVYARHIRTPGIGWLFALRLVVVLMLAAILIDVVVTHDWTKRPRRFAVLLDRSNSMTASGADSHALTAASAFPVPRELATEFWVFADTTERVAEPGVEVAAPGRTRLGEALRSVLRSGPGAIVVISDGQDNGELDPVAVVREAGIPVYAVGCGSAGKRNLAAVHVSTPVELYAGDTVGITARLRYCGIQNEEVTVRLNRGYKKVRLRDEVAEQEFFFRTIFEKPGRQLVRFSVDSLPGESNLLDNRLEVTVDVRPARLRVTYLTNRPGPGTRFTIAALERNPRVELKHAIELVPGKKLRKDDIGDPDVIVLDGVAETRAAVWQEIARLVRAGTGVLVLAGPDFRAGEFVGKLIPAPVKRHTGSFPAEPTRAGRMVGWLADNDFEQLPPFAGLCEPVGAGNVEVWLTAGPDGLPLVTAGRAGKGRVVYVAGYPFWRWGFSSRVRDDANPFSDFLGGAVRFLGEKETERFRLETGKPEYHSGEPVSLVLRAVAPGGGGWEGLDAVAMLDVPGAPADSAGPAVPMVAIRVGVYEAELAAVPPGEHQATVLVSLDDSVIGRATVDFAVTEVDLEFADTGLNRGLLAAVAAAGGGMYFRWDSLPGEGFEPVLGELQRRFRFDPRRTPWFYALIALLAGLEWVLRRRKGLM